MRRIVVMAAVCALAAGLLAAPTSAQTSAPEPCGLTTLDGRVVYVDGDKDGDPDEGRPLQCAPGQATVVRDELAAASPGRAADRTTLGSWINIADVQLADEESPMRGEWADKCGSHPFTSAFRTQETMVPHLLNAHVQAAARISAVGGPKTGDDIDFVIGLGDLADNQQLNEIRLIIDLFDGAKLVDPDSGNDDLLGGDGYDGVQGASPQGSEAPLGSPSRGGPPLDRYETIMDIANEPFWAHGLFARNRQIPWYSLPGNHDVKVQGTIPDDNPAWRNLMRRWATGRIKVMDLAPDYQQRLCEAFEEQDEEKFQSVMMEIFSDPARAGTTKVVPSDPDRMPLYRTDESKQAGDEEACAAATGLPQRCETSWLEEHFTTTGIPVGHGYGRDKAGHTPTTVEKGRCTDSEGAPLGRACYSFTHGLFHFIALDTTPAAGRENGAIDEAQWQWLQRELVAHSSEYFGEDGSEQTNKKAADKLIVIVTHHTIGSTGNEIPIAMGQHSGAELKDLLLRFPNVIMQNSGHTHENRVFAYENEELDTGYWELNTAAVVDSPTQSRVIEVANNNDGTLSIFGTIFDALVPADPRKIHWHDHDHTHESRLGAEHDINEDWLASFGREVTYYDPQADLTAVGKPKDFNVELLIPAPDWLDRATVETTLTYTGDRSAKVGSKANVSAVLSTRNGSGLKGMTVTFSRRAARATAVTDSRGRAATTLRVHGPPGSKHPVIVSFGGSDVYLPSEISVPFTATTGNDGRRPRTAGPGGPAIPI